MSRRRRMMADLAQDIREHIAIETQDNIDRGMSPEEARYAALRKFGNVVRVQEDTREVWGFLWLEQLLQDIRFGLRMLRKSPGFAAVAILTLALGIGANTAIFSLLDAVVLRSLPVHDPARLVLLKWSASNPPNTHGYLSAGDCPSDLRMGPRNPSGCSFSEPMFREIEKANIFSGTAAFAVSGRLNLTGNGPASVISGQLLSGDFFRTMGLKAAAGRLFDASDDTPAAAPVAVLNYGYWQNAFGGSHDVIGRVIEVNKVPFTIVGVAERRFNGITPGSDFDIWMPLSNGQRISGPAPFRWSGRQADPAFWWLTILGRLKERTTTAQAQAVVSGLFRNQMLHGPVPIFHGDQMGALPPRSNMPIGSAPPGHDVMRAMPPASQGSEPANPVATPKKITLGKTDLSRGVMPQSAGNHPLMKMAPPADAADNQQTLSTAADSPEVKLVPAQSGLIGGRARYSDPLYLLMLGVGIILLIACANVAGLMLARGAARQKEMAVRLALGGGRVRIMRQLLTESLMLSVLAGALGVLFAYWGAHAIISIVATSQSRPLGFVPGVDLRVLGFTIAVSLLTGILFGIAPAFLSVRIALTPALKEGEGHDSNSVLSGGRGFNAGNILVVAQVALAIVLLVGAGLLVRTLANLRGIELGFEPHNVLIFRIDPTLAGYRGPQVDSFYRDLQGRLSEIPGVTSVSYSMGPLLSGGQMSYLFHWPETPADQKSEADELPIGPNFFETMQIPAIAGRGFTASDFAITASNQEATPSSVPTPVIVNRTFVDKYLGKENPLGTRFGATAANATDPADPGYEIVGVVHDAKYSDLRREIRAMMFVPHSGLGASFEVRTRTNPATVLPAIRNVVGQINSNLPLFDVNTESEQIDRLLFQERLVARFSGLFGLLAMILACIGLYGLLSYEVTRRTREIGIRMAFGAPARSVLTLVVRHGIALTMLGSALGIGVALAVTRYLAGMLYHVRVNDPVTLIVVAVLLTLVALASCCIPARRAMRVDPMIALRYE